MELGVRVVGGGGGRGGDDGACRVWFATFTVLKLSNEVRYMKNI